MKNDLDSGQSPTNPITLKQRLLGYARNVGWLALIVGLTLTAHGLLIASRVEPEESRIDEIGHRVQYELGHAIASGEMTEFDLGEFTTTVHCKALTTTLRIDFRVALVVSEEDRAAFEQFLAARKNRLRDKTLSVMNTLPTQDLLDPNLRELKAAVAASANDLYGDSIVVTSSFGRYSYVDQF